MKKVITYGTFDLFHNGHYRILERSKKLGDYLIVGVCSDNYDRSRGKLNVEQSLAERIEAVKKTNLADEIIVEEYEGQKIHDILRFDIDIFAIGSDWIGKFDYLKEYCEVNYLERTKGVSSTEIRNNNNGIISLGIIGSGRIANRFILESKYVSGVNIEGIFNPNINSAKKFADEHELNFYTNEIEKFYAKIDAVYIASPHLTHYEYIKTSLLRDKHVLCEKPLVLSKNHSDELYELAKKRNLILIEALKTAFSPSFRQLITIAKSGAIGCIKDIEASFTKLTQGNLRELDKKQAGGSITELSSYVLLPIIKLLGTNYSEIKFHSFFNEGIDYFTKGIIIYPEAIASFKVGLGVKTEGSMVISGTKGYIYVPAPWWKSSYFEIRYENSDLTKKYFNNFEGDGLRYELNSFIKLINKGISFDEKIFTAHESSSIIGVIEKFLKKENVFFNN